MGGWRADGAQEVKLCTVTWARVGLEEGPSAYQMKEGQPRSAERSRLEESLLWIKTHSPYKSADQALPGPHSVPFCPILSPLGPPAPRSLVHFPQP